MAWLKVFQLCEQHDLLLVTIAISFNLTMMKFGEVCPLLKATFHSSLY